MDEQSSKGSMQDRVAIVTGGALGIGGATARRLAEAGARVLAVDIAADELQQNVGRITSAGGNAAGMVGDISERSVISGMVQRAVDEWGRIDILVNNAWGSREPDRSALDLSESAFDYAMNVMVKALFRATKEAAPHMARIGKGSIVNIASVHGLLAAPNRLSYDTAKAAAIHLTRQMAVDLGPMGIRVNAICPGHIVTERSARRWAQNPTMLEFFRQQYPGRQVGEPDDIAYAVRYLCSDEAKFVTGHALVVDGGLTVQLQEDHSLRLAQYFRDHPDTALP